MNADALDQFEDSIASAIAAQVKQLRLDRGMTIEALAGATGVSRAMISKLERAQTSASLSTLARLALGLDVPVTSFFRGLDEEPDEVVFVPAGSGAEITRPGTKVGHRYELLGALREPFTAVEPVLVTMDDRSEVFPLFQHPGIEMIYVLDGDIDYSVGAGRYTLTRGDSLLFRGSVAHGPTRLIRTPIRFLSFKVGSHQAG